MKTQDMTIEEKIRASLEEEFKDFKALMSVKEVASTGYVPARYVYGFRTYGVPAIRVGSRTFVPKTALIDYLCKKFVKPL